MYTANTMSSAFEALGVSLPYSSTMANPHDEKQNSAYESGKAVIEAIRLNIRPTDLVTRKSIENAVAVIMATGGSTNAVLHFLAIAHAAGVDWSIDDFERIRQRTPVLCDLKPSGKYLAVDLHRAGGIPAVMKLLLDAGLLHGDCITITGKTVAENLKDVPALRADQDVIRPISQPMYDEGHLAILKGNLSPEGCVAKITGLKNPVITGPARVFDDEQSALAAIRLAIIQPAPRSRRPSNPSRIMRPPRWLSLRVRKLSLISWLSRKKKPPSARIIASVNGSSKGNASSAALTADGSAYFSAPSHHASHHASSPACTAVPRARAPVSGTVGVSPTS